MELTGGLSEQRKHYDAIRRKFFEPRPKVIPIVNVEAPVSVPIQYTIYYSAGEAPPPKIEWAPQYPAIRDIVRAVSKSYGVSVHDINSDRRSMEIVLPRHVAMYLAKDLTTRSLPYIGGKMGGKDHTSVLHAIRRIRRQMETDPELTARIEMLQHHLKVPA